MIVRNTKDKGLSEVYTDGVFVVIGHDPNTAFLKGQVDMDDAAGTIKVKGRSTYSSVPGVFVAGDVADSVYPQAITSAGTGAAAAIDCERWLNEIHSPEATSEIRSKPSALGASKPVAMRGSVKTKGFLAPTLEDAEALDELHGMDL